MAGESQAREDAEAEAMRLAQSLAELEKRIEAQERTAAQLRGEVNE